MEMNLTNPMIEKAWVTHYKNEGYEVSSLSEVENIVKQEAIERIRKHSRLVERDELKYRELQNRFSTHFYARFIKV